MLEPTWQRITEQHEAQRENAKCITVLVNTPPRTGPPPGSRPPATVQGHRRLACDLEPAEIAGNRRQSTACRGGSTNWTNFINKLIQHEPRAVGAGWHLDGSQVLAKWRIWLCSSCSAACSSMALRRWAASARPSAGQFPPPPAALRRRGRPHGARSSGQGAGPAGPSRRPS